MNVHKNKKYFAVVTIAFWLLLSACSKLCKSGYESSRCNELTVTKFEGNWNAVDSPANLTYTDTITKGTAINDIAFSISFAGHRFNHIINASVLESAITIPYQQPDSDSLFVQGTGTLSSDNNHISLNYQLISGRDTPYVVTNYSGAWTRVN